MLQQGQTVTVLRDHLIATKGPSPYDAQVFTFSEEPIDLTTMGAQAPLTPELVALSDGNRASDFPNMSLSKEQLSLNLFLAEGRIADLEREFRAFSEWVLERLEPQNEH